MRRSKFYNMRLPERSAREGEANDAADIEDLTYDLGIIDAEMERQRLEDVRLEKDKATKLEMSQHKSAAVLDHPDGSVTDAKLGQRTVLTTSGTLQTLLTAIGNAIKAISGADTWNGTPATTLKDAKTHMGDAVKHITAQEREIWNAAATDRHSHTNKSVLDSITAAMVTAWNTVSSKLPLAGGTLTGFLTLHAAPATDMHAATKKYVDDKMAASGSGDMTKAVYDPGGRELPYIPKQDVDALAWGGDFGASGTPVSIAYAGAQRIASITAYGENAQGGTTETPVALTGVENVFVGGRNLLPKATKTQTIYGVTFTPNPDGSVSVSGTCAGGIATYNYADNLIPISPNQVVCLSGASQLVKVVINEKTPSGAFVRNVLVDRGQGISGTLTKQKEENILYDTLQVQIGDTPNLTIYPMLNLGNTAMPYEPYQGSVTQLPIPRPLHEVGDVRDICCTRVKSVYDKRIVIDQNSDIFPSGDVSVVGTSRRFNIELPDLPATPYDVLGAVACDKLPRRTAGGSSGGTYGRDELGISVQNDSNSHSINFRVPGCKTLEEIKSWLTDNPLTVYYQSTSYNGANGLDICLTEYQNGSIELDGTESNLQFFSEYQTLAIKGITTSGDPSQANAYGVCISSHFALVPPGTSTTLDKVVYGQPKYNQIIIHDTSWNSLETAKAYLAAQKAAGTPVQVAYQLATPETYATDPLDIDNAAGPLTVMTGGEVEVRMTELVGSRSPEIVAKMDKATYDADGDGVVDRAGSVDGGTY